MPSFTSCESGKPMNESGGGDAIDDRVATARGLADQLFEADLRGRHAIERTGELALGAWQAFAVRKGNRGLYAVLEQCDRFAFCERWRELATVYAERGEAGVFAALARSRPTAPPAPGERPS
jgi:hypothetical protein